MMEEMPLLREEKATFDINEQAESGQECVSHSIHRIRRIINKLDATQHTIHQINCLLEDNTHLPTFKVLSHQWKWKSKNLCKCLNFQRMTELEINLKGNYFKHCQRLTSRESSQYEKMKLD